MLQNQVQKRLEVVTTFSPAGYKLYGERFIDTFLEFWPESVLLTVYVDEYPLKYHPNKNQGRLRFKSMPDELENFKTDNQNNLDAHGMASGQYSMRRDAVKFAHKSYVMCDASRKTRADTLIWLDADTVTHAKVEFNWLSGILAENNFLAWLNRDNNYPECGILFFNRHSFFYEQYFRKVRQLYSTGEIFELPQTHDSWVWQYVADKMDIKPLNLSGSFSSVNHPFIHVFGHVMDHLKGEQRKIDGRSFQNDLKINRKEKYWE